MSDEIESSSPEVVMIGEDPNEKASQVLDTNDSNNESVIDELTSIERDLAIMHDIEDDGDGVALGVLQSGIVEDALAMGCDSVGFEGQAATSMEDVSDKQDNKLSERRNGNSTVLDLGDAPDSTGSPATNKSDDAPLLHDDLLAVLKGTDTETDELKKDKIGVTIEGEGEFQIVDIIDNDVEFTEAEDPLAKEVVTQEAKKEPLSQEEVRKVVLEQMNSLKSMKNRRRKQDIKSIIQPADLVTSLVSDWSDGDDANPEDSDESVSPPKKKVPGPAVQVKSTQAPKPVPLKAAQPLKVAQPAKATPAPQKPAPKSVQQVKVALGTKPAPKSVQTQKAVQEVAAPTAKKVLNATVAATATTSQPKKVINTAPVQEKKTPALPPPSTFKRTRIIKRKIIWDPDAPETQFSYAKLVKPSTPAPPKKERTVPAAKKAKEEPEEEEPRSTSPVKRPSSTTPSINGNRKKKSGEIDRLLGDEGAANMLNSLDSDTTRASAARKATLSPPERAVTAPLKKETVLPKRRTPKPKASSSWDYVYKKKQEQEDDSMIIRRRSNSSYSSSASINRLSIDGPGSAGKATKNALKPSTSSSTAPQEDNSPETGKQFEFAKPESKSKNKKIKSPIVIVNPLSADMKKAVTTKRTLKSPVLVDDEETDEDGDVVVANIGSVRQVTFNTHRAKLGHTFTVQLMNELSSVLNRLSNDADCNAVLLLSEGPNFCQGIDFTDLALGAPEKRKNAAVIMARAVKKFLSTLVKFRKPLIAGVNGSNSGLGVTMLPLFDVVIGSDKGTYETPYAKIGQIPEGYFIISETPKIRSTFKTKLLWLSEKLHSTESALSGLVNKLTSVSKVNEEALSTAKRIASLSSETYSVMKKRSTDEILPQILDALEEEEEILVRQWCSAPCVENFKHFIHKAQW